MHLAEMLAAPSERSRHDRACRAAAAERVSATFVGMPAFPEAARAALADTQLRRNLAHATGTIRAKRAAVVAEVDDWEELRLAGAAIKDDTLRTSTSTCSRSRRR